MQLGSILNADPGEPMVSRPVEFYMLKQNPNEGLRRVRVQALLLPVSEADRQRSKVEVVRFLRHDPNSPYRTDEKKEEGYEISTPTGEEGVYRFLSYALYDVEEPTRRLVRDIDYPLFRKGLVLAQVEWLSDQYKKLIEQEYPEIVSPQEKEDLVAQAEGK